MNQPLVSICMCSYRRAPLLRRTLESIATQGRHDLEIIICEDGDDGGATRKVCEDFGARYLQRADRPDQPYCNPSISWNMSMRQARGEILILQNPECFHVGNVIEQLIHPHVAYKNAAAFASVEALLPNGQFWQWYCHPEHSPRPFFFCGSIRAEHVFRIRGFDEDFGRAVGGYGYDDNFFSYCLQKAGIEFLFLNAHVRHQWHESTGCFGLQDNQQLFMRKIGEIEGGKRTFVSNEGHDWGRG